MFVWQTHSLMMHYIATLWYTLATLQSHYNTTAMLHYTAPLLLHPQPALNLIPFPLSRESQPRTKGHPQSHLCPQEKTCPPHPLTGGRTSPCLKARWLETPRAPALWQVVRNALTTASNPPVPLSSTNLQFYQLLLLLFKCVCTFTTSTIPSNTSQAAQCPWLS